jgi:hypothetical protein
METHRKAWNTQHALIRRILIKERDYRKALPLLLEHHSAVHSGKLPLLREDRGGRWSYQDEVLSGLSDAQFRHIPAGGQSIVWKIWHITRIEDLTLSLLLAGLKKSILNESWLEKLRIEYVDVGNDMPDADAAMLSRSMNVKALLAYRLAVGKHTQRILSGLDPERLWEKPAAEQIQRIVKEKAVRPKAAWLLKFWGGNPRANLFLMPAARHPFVHLNEISRMLPRLRRINEETD